MFYLDSKESPDGRKYKSLSTQLSSMKFDGTTDGAISGPDRVNIFDQQICAYLRMVRDDSI